MNLGNELTAAFGREAEMREVPPPDVDRLIRAGQARRRRRNARRIGAAVAAAVIVGGGTYGVVRVDRGETAPVAVPPTTSQSAPPAVPSRFPDFRNMTTIAPGTYRVFVGSDTAGDKIEADLTMTNPTSNWSWSGQPVVHLPTVDAWAGVGVYQPRALARVAPCSGNWQSSPASSTPQSLARQLVRLPWSTIVEPPTPTEAFGHDAIHLKLQVDDRCPWDEYYQIAKAEAQPADSLASSRGISYGNASEEVVVDFWVVDLGGTAVVVDTWHQVDSSAELVDRATEVLDSIQFVFTE